MNRLQLYVDYIWMQNGSIGFWKKKHNPHSDMCTTVSVNNAVSFITVWTCTTWYTACKSEDDGKDGKNTEDQAGSKRSWGQFSVEEFQRYCVLPLSPSDKWFKERIMGILKAKNSAADKGTAAVASLSIHNHRVEMVVCTSVRRGLRQRSPERNRKKINK